MEKELHILQTWAQNATPWVNAIRNEEIESRKLVTNSSIIEAVQALHPSSIWDVGCGEGWLCRQLSAAGINCIGSDAIPELIEKARLISNNPFYLASYQDIIEGRFLPKEMPELVVFNFSLFGNELVENLLRAIRLFMQTRNHLVIQTLHPFTATGDTDYQDGWREGSWQGFSSDFVNAAPWYFRTMASWINLLKRCGFVIGAIQEPLHPHTQKPASLILIASV